MARLAKIVKNKKREKLVAKCAKKRAELKEIIRNPKSSPEDAEIAVMKLSKMSRNASRTRIRNRCELTGRSRGYLRKFGLCRIAFRELALNGELPGVTKASW